MLFHSFCQTLFFKLWWYVNWISPSSVFDGNVLLSELIQLTSELLHWSFGSISISHSDDWLPFLLKGPDYAFGKSALIQFLHARTQINPTSDICKCEPNTSSNHCGIYSQKSFNTDSLANKMMADSRWWSLCSLLFPLGAGKRISAPLSGENLSVRWGIRERRNVPACWLCRSFDDPNGRK